jgi:hypothetical protein
VFIRSVDGRHRVDVQVICADLNGRILDFNGKADQKDHTQISDKAIKINRIQTEMNGVTHRLMFVLFIQNRMAGFGISEHESKATAESDVNDGCKISPIKNM